MIVAYYETRQNFKQLSYIIYLDPMHGCEVIKCMKLGGFSVKLQFPGN